jgi:RNA polymerase sigma factor (sigma-70 family)|tara:strand:- start:15857 stop:16378 length:522 start_codon:yes stop_codon:yes gene_type:complete
MIIDNALVAQWEPKIQKMSSSSFVIGMDREDIAQELRIALIKAARKFDESRGVSFHTYLHTAMVNTIRTLISQAQRHLNTTSLDKTFADSEMLPLEIVEALSDTTDFDSNLFADDLLGTDNITDQERQFVLLRGEGLTMSEITEDLGESAYKIRQALRDKLEDAIALKEPTRV